MIFKLFMGVTFSYLVVISFNTNAALVGRDLDGNTTTAEAYYDDEAKLTWLADAGSFLGHWNQANNWALNLNIGGVTGWRLPDTLQPDPSCSNQSVIGGGFPVQGWGVNCTGSEMGNLFYNVLGGVAGDSIFTTHNANFYLFSNIQDTNYWSATTCACTSPIWHYAFDFSTGQQGRDSNDDISTKYAWAVQSGDVGTAVSTVPIPAAFWLFGSGLIGLIGLAKRKKA